MTCHGAILSGMVLNIRGKGNGEELIMTGRIGFVYATRKMGLEGG